MFATKQPAKKNLRHTLTEGERIMTTLIDEIVKLNLGSIELLALVTSTSYEVVFYATVNGKKYQSNALTAEGLFDILKMDEFYSKVATIIRNASNFKSDSMNIVTVNSSATIKWEYAERNCRIYPIKKNWKNSFEN